MLGPFRLPGAFILSIARSDNLNALHKLPYALRSRNVQRLGIVTIFPSSSKFCSNVQVRLPDDLRQRIEQYQRSQPIRVTLSETVRYLIELRLTAFDNAAEHHIAAAEQERTPLAEDNKA